ncbi:MAG: hypothetical protein KKH44_08480 [Bacteroidetes bacterium]|nr:hypothetical protein [Bacteroidota bacterium]
MLQPDIREKLRANSSNTKLMEGIKDALVEGFKAKGAEETFKLAFEKTEDPEVKNLLTKLTSVMNSIYSAIPRTISLPKIFNIKGSVQVENAITVKNQKDLEKRVDDVSTQIRLLANAISSIPQQKIEFPKIDIPKAEKMDLEPLKEAISELKESMGKEPKNESVPVLRKIQTAIQELVNRPQMTPQPVTNVNINPLQGFTKTTSATVGTTVATLPEYGQLFNRRSIIIYNNSANTIFIGGSDVTIANGLPVIASTFSPSIDAGYNMKIYAVSASAGNDVRVLEISKNKEADVQG